jgi:hypothetical protein
MYAQFLIILGRPDEAMREVERAVAIDPLSPSTRSLYAGVLVFARRYA